ncbi:MAG: ABC transporter permease [Phycisphaeraceae bacterium]|nr:ABC transporter permease [Phycisphaeraceae bacterium]
MINPRHLPLVFKQVVRHRTRTLLTVGGVAAAMFLFCAVQAMQHAVARATDGRADETTLVVYRENRFCPFTSRLPEHYERRIVAIPHVRSVVPLKIVVNNCRAGLDVITFRGVPEESVESLGLRILEGSLEAWRARGDAALVGRSLAARRGLSVGQSFDAAGVTVTVAGIVDSDAPQDQSVAYVHLPFLQRAARGGGQGIVTQFNVKVDEARHLEAVARAIDAEFRDDQEPTYTSPETAFIARAAHDVVEIVGFTRWLGWACLAAVLGLVANAIVLSVQDRVKEHAILQTLGFRSGLIAALIVLESILLSLLGGAAGAGAAAGVLAWGHFALTVEGVNIAVAADPLAAATGVGLAALLGVAAGLFPAWRASRRPIAQCFRAV